MNSGLNGPASTPRPCSAAIGNVSGLTAAVHSGGCGFWIGLGMTSISGKLQNCPSNENRSSPQARRRISSPSSTRARLSDIFPPKTSYSSGETPRPTPTSIRPPERMSSAAIRSATRTGWLNGRSTTPCPIRIRSVRWLIAPKMTSGAGQCEYSRKKWCSTSHTPSKPALSASAISSSECS